MIFCKILATIITKKTSHQYVFLVTYKMLFICKILVTMITLKWLFPNMCFLVTYKAILTYKIIATKITLKLLLIIVYSAVLNKNGFVCKTFHTEHMEIFSNQCVFFDVFEDLILKKNIPYNNCIYILSPVLTHSIHL